MTDQMRAPYDAARSLYPLLPKWYEETDDCETPEFHDLNAGGLPVFCIPPAYSLTDDESAHEAGHAYLRLLERAHPELDYLSAYWTFRDFPGSWEHALAESQAKAGNEAWMLDPRESWAEAFARSCVPTHSEKTLTYGLDVEPLAARAFFQSLNDSATTTAETNPNLGQPTPLPQVTTATLRYCFDSTNARDIPPGAEIVAGYVDGLYAWSDEDWMLFPDSVKVSIAVFEWTDAGMVGDVEPGCMTPQGFVSWLQRRRRAGVDPTGYVNLGNWQATRDAVAAAGLVEPHWWVASYDNDPTPIEGAVAKQYANPTFTGKHYDVSVVSGRWPGIEEDELAFKDDPDAQQFKNDMLNWQKDVNDRLAKDAHHKHPAKTIVLPESGEPEAA